jgi:hypothetical protein
MYNAASGIEQSIQAIGTLHSLGGIVEVYIDRKMGSGLKPDA